MQHLMTPDQLKTPADVDALARDLYGPDFCGPDFDPTPGVVHVTSAWRTPAGTLRTILINDSSPKSAYDFFVLNFSRARADAIVITGKILREEENVSHRLQGEAATALERWRRERRGESAPISLVLSSGRGLDLDHRLFQDAERAVVYTSEEGRQRLAGPAQERGIEVVAGAGIRGAVTWLRDQGAGTIAIEAGPSSAQQLYRAPILVDELLLSVYEEPHLPAAAVGLDASYLETASSSGSADGREVSEGGRWRFSRHLSLTAIGDNSDGR